MSKWVAVLASSFMTLASLGLLLIPFIYNEPVRASYIVFVVMFLGSGWWLVKTIRTPAVKEPEPEPTEEQVVSPAKTGLIFLGILAIIPWAIIWVNVFAPLFGMQNWSIKGHLIFVIGIPAVAMWLFVKIKSLRDDA